MRKPNRTLWVFKYLWEQTDDEHPATIADITAYLESQGQTVKDYRVIQADIAELASMGIDIVEDRSRHYEYSIGTRHFEVPEVKLLVDAVQSSRFISQKKSKALIKKLSAFVGPQDANIIKRQLYVDQRFKATNGGIMRIVDSVQDAIAAKTKVTFQYYDYSPQKKKVARHDGAFYVVSPYSLDYFLVQLYNLLGHGLQTPFRMVCGNFILPEFCKPCLFLFPIQFAQLIVLYLARRLHKAGRLLPTRCLLTARRRTPHRRLRAAAASLSEEASPDTLL